MFQGVIMAMTKHADLRKPGLEISSSEMGIVEKKHKKIRET
jgi:hypothetical protein